MGSGHVCEERDGFELMMVSYPHAIFRCRICQMIIHSIPVDDLEADDFDFSQEMIRRYRRAHGKA